MGVAELKAKARDSFKRKNYDHAVEIYLEAFQYALDDLDLIEGFHQAASKAREGKGKGMFGGLGRAALGATRDPEKRLVACLRHLAKHPEDKGGWMEFGSSGEDAKQLNAAMYGFKVAARLDPEDNQAWKRLGSALYRQGKIKEASEAYGEAVRIDPKDQEAIKMRKNLAAEGALKMSGYETAKSSRDLIKNKEAAGQSERDIRLQLTDQDATDEVARLRADIVKNPATAARTLIRLSDVLLQKGDLPAAMVELDLAVKADPSNYDLATKLGDLKLSVIQQAFEKAKAAFTASGETDDTALRAARARLLDSRLVEYGRRVREHPTDLAERYKLGATLLMAGKTNEAVGEFQKTVQDPRRKVDSLLRLGECFEKMNMLDLAAKKVQEAAESFPNMATDRAKEITYRLGELHERRGAKDDAKREYMKIYEVDIGYLDVAERLQKLA